MIVQPRDRELLWQLFLMRVASRDHLMVAAGFRSITRINTRLLALYRAGLLRRFFIGSGGGRKALYALSDKGAALIAVPCRGPRRRQDELLAADFSILHQLTINDVYCNLKFHPVPVPHVQFVNWMTLTEPIAQGSRLIPDGYVEFRTPLGIDASFLEIDLGTEGLSIWKEKTARYLQFAASGEFARRFTQSRFRVLVLANSSRRLRSIRAAVGEITHKVFWFAAIEDAREGKFFSPVWLRATGMQPQSLFVEPR